MANEYRISRFRRSRHCWRSALGEFESRPEIHIYDYRRDLRYGSLAEVRANGIVFVLKSRRIAIGQRIAVRQRCVLSVTEEGAFPPASKSVNFGLVDLAIASRLGVENQQYEQWLTWAVLVRSVRYSCDLRVMSPTVP